MLKWKADYQNYLLQAFLKDFAILSLCAYAVLGLFQSSLGFEIDLPFFELPPSVFVLNWLLTLAPLLAWSLLIDVRALSIVSLCSTAGFAYLNHRKITELGEPIEILDFYNFQASPLLIRYVGMRELLAVVTVLAWPFAYRFTANKLWRRKHPWALPHVVWVAVTLGLLALFAAVCLEPFRNNSRILQAFPPHPNHADTSLRYGLPLSSLLNLKFLQVFHPNNYSEEVVRKLVSLKPVVAPPKTVMRDVVLVLLESFRDYSLDGVPFREDPIPFYHRLKQESHVGSYYSPGLGGGTANVEYEVLTGMSTAFLPQNSIPYLQYVDHDIPSAVGWLTMAGYETYAVHNNFGTYFNRRRVYESFKFKKFFDILDLTKEFGQPQDPAHTDRLVFQKSLGLLAEKRNKPQFQYLITLNTHSPYNGVKSNRHWIPTYSFGDDDLAEQINVYSDRMNELDSELARYFGELKKMKNPPAVILFGDHHPSMSIRLPFPTPSARHNVEAVVWNDHSGRESPARAKAMPCLSPELLRASGVPLAPFFEYVERYCKNHDFDGPIQLTAANVNDLAGYEILCYDRLFGQKFSIATSLNRAAP